MDFIVDRETKNLPKSHYYGDTVRRLLIAGGTIMIVTLPFFGELIPVPLVVSILAIVVVGVVSGLINPRQKWTSTLDFAISIIGFICFEYLAANTYASDGEYFRSLFFWTNQTLAIIFFIATYYGVKTLRGFYINKNNLDL
ncbi:hypothetical protein A3B18_03160 [Candidatus Giovannonibacteria bacterium RIFCSPLOWO2_01_FULL_46_13]|uniref:Uncharacterized protein n=1 Tax=Candidatus Giovannonibacteria bacterium RIFCSPLOWO2_01_FULL_46_13 TaxID=1798352 RepID=A0A1F5X344_9BACT|nr:MAG: hypothetical protein A3B18_03160 [Candidatus Giovannonibacteria bacterium RIFCSPLOWO2_01_FULL_46_13]